MARIKGPDCAVLCNFINTHTVRKNGVFVGKEIKKIL